ncbi:MAG: alpha/beta hydrolase [Thermodesulfobacteriota bacterium]|nr:alpha/beta hydrolase [Thermodesulfobacteriota bacterium]
MFEECAKVISRVISSLTWSLMGDALPSTSSGKANPTNLIWTTVFSTIRGMWKRIKMKRFTGITGVFLCIVAVYGCKQAVNRMAFFPDNTDILSTEQLPENVQEIFIETEDWITIHSYFIPHRSSDKIILYFHGNAGNIGHRLPDLLRLSTFGVNVLGVSYRGYGKSQGKPSEEGIYIDGKASLNYATQRLGFSLHNVFLFGRSIGTTVAINTSQNLDIGGLILVTPLTSGKDHAHATGLGLVAFLAGNSFNNIKKIVNVSCPLLIIHGTQDKVVPFEMGKRMYNEAKTEKQFVQIEGAGHNNLSTVYKQRYWPPIYAFFAQKKMKAQKAP